MKRRLILLELNEVNFDLVEEYVSADSSRFPSLRRLLAMKSIRTTSEHNYSELEPWIQWPSVHLGKSFKEHGIFRLGDIIHSPDQQIFEVIEDCGFKVGAISAMNAANRLKNPAYFIPDPWTNTRPDISFWSRLLTEALSQAINDNSGNKIKPKSVLQILAAFVYFAQLRHLKIYFEIFFGSRTRPWLKVLFLDLLLHDIHLKLFENRSANFSVLFLNGCAHLQHHYFFNSIHAQIDKNKKNPEWYVKKECDPILDVLELYDIIIGELLNKKGVDLLVVTGLSQIPYDRVKFYYRLKDHVSFLRLVGLSFKAVSPKMTRDFVIEFDDVNSSNYARSTLESIFIVKDGLPLFGEIDNRGSSLFVTLTYPFEIDKDTVVSANGHNLYLIEYVNFVAIKNGMHQGLGFAFFTEGISIFSPSNFEHVSKLNGAILKFFGADKSSRGLA